MTWPTDRPGYPMHAERDGWHWLKHPEDLRPFPSAWNAELRGWPSGALHSPQGIVDLGFAYLGPCYTQADLDAAVQAEREACADVAYGTYDDRMTVGEEETAQGAYDAAVSIQARGPTPALDAALAQARQEGHDEAATDVAVLREFYDAAMAEWAAPAKKHRAEAAMKAADAVHARLFGPAIRSAAAGEEGK